MKKLLQRFELKRKTAACMAVILATMAFLPYFPERMVSLADYAQLIEPVSLPSWDASRYSADNYRGYIPTGLMYENKDFHLGAPVTEGNFPAGTKQYLVKNNQSGESAYDEFDKTFIYCVDGHTENAMIHLGSQAFFEGFWTPKNPPHEFPKGENAKNKEFNRFNFLMIVYATHMGRNDSIAACNDANTGTAKYIVASIINWLAADDCVFTGDWDHDIAEFRDSDNYKAVVKQMNPNAVGDRSVYNQLSGTQVAPEYAARGCKNWAEWMFGNVWDAASITKYLDTDAEETVYFAKMDHSTDTYTITIPYPNDVVKGYYQGFSAKDLYGDWTYSGPTDAGLVFTSMSGEVPTDGKGIGTLYWSNPNQVGAVLAKDLGSAQLATFKFYTQIPGNLGGLVYAFDRSQTYFAAKMDKDLEVHVRIGSGGTGEVQRFKHTEGFGASYNVGLLKYDSETGKPLANSQWDILEKFDDSQLDSTDLDLESPGDYSSNTGSLTGASWEEDIGSEEARITTNYSGDIGLNDSKANLYNQANSSGSQFERWDDPEQDPCAADKNITDENGELHYVDSQGNIHSKIAHSDVRSYTYEKGYCSGHPAPVVEYEEVPEPEYDEETGDQTNEDEIEAVEEYNQQLHDSAWAQWLASVEECERLVEEGGFFHAIDPTGKTQREALEADRDRFYLDFISLTYEYSAKETTPAPGYSLHGSHPDDIPMEWRTITSSEYKDYRSGGLDHTGGGSGDGPDMEGQRLNTDASIKPLNPEALEKVMFTSFGTSNRVKVSQNEITEVQTENDTDIAEHSEGKTAEDPEQDITEKTGKESEPEQDTAEETQQESEEETESEAVEETEESTEVEEEKEPESEPETISEAIEEFKDETEPVTEEETQPESQAETKAVVSKKKQTATDSEAERVNGGVTLTGLLETVVSGLRSVANKAVSFFRLGEDDEDSGSASSLKGLLESTETSRLDPLDSSIKDWTFIAYDHRTEGEIHFNKKDMDLKAGESDSYSAYGDSQGDGILEGAVYGLFAATDIPHPDGHSGVLFKKDNLVSVAATDRNGDASFLAITQAPGYTYNYQTGAIGRTPGGWADQAPANLYTAMGKAIGKETDAERFVGHTERGSSITLTDSRNETAAGYEKLSSNQGKDGTGESSHSYPIENNEDLNGNCWIGRPLIVNADGTQYYIKELTRSEGYELSVYGKDAAISNWEAFEAGGNPSAEGTVSAGRIGIDRVKKINTFTVKSSETTNGYQIYAQNIPKGASFYITRSEVVEDPNGTHTEYVTKEETALVQEEGTRVIINGSPVMAKVGDTSSLPNGETAVVGKVSDAEYDYTAVRPDNALRYTIPTFQDKKNTEDLMDDANVALKRASFKEPDEGAPWIMIPVTGDTFEEQAASLYEGMEAAGLSVFNCLRIQEITDGKAMIRYSYRVGSSVSASIYDEVKKILYIRNSIDYEIKGTNVFGYLYTAYTPDQFEDFKENGNGFVTYVKVKAGELSKNNAVYPEDLSAITVLDSPERTYWVYSQGEPLRNNDGSIKKVLVEEEVQVAPGYELKDVDTPVAATYDGIGYVIEVAGSEGTESIDYKIKYQDDFVEGTYITPEEYAGYYGNISVTPNMAGAGTYIETVTLRYDRNQIYTDGGTRSNKVSVVERPIMQKVKITKDISINAEGTYDDNTYAGTGHEDCYTEHGGGTEENTRYLKNFRFKVYLKSNLERLYRAEDGTVTWQDRNGNTVDILAYRNSFPGKVQKLFTKVDYRTDSVTRDSNRAAIANTELYGYMPDETGQTPNNYINTDQNPGYTAILEKTIQKVKDESGNDREVNGYNYEKFFEAIKVANDDKWDRTENGSSSFKPVAFIKQLLFGIGGAEKQYPAIHNNLDMRNSINTSDTASENALRSDNVRQFAITWYLDKEVAKLISKNQSGEMQSGSGYERYQDEIYDKALSEAIKKAENYLEPFFSYDFDQIYSIAWDSEADGGKDQDKTTLSADQEAPEAGYTYGISEYLPYGTYIAVEQQPFCKDLGDLYNKHYKTDAPKEIELPAVYEGGKYGADKTPEALSIYYQYKAADTALTLSAKYQIRFNEEWPGENGDDLRKYVIRAHNRLGYYEIYPYGLDLDKLNGNATGDPYGHGHFTVTQGVNDPVKDYYNTLVDPVEAGGNPSSHYIADDGNTGKRTANGSTYETNGVEKIYRYGSISEDKQIYDNVSFPSGAGELYRDHVMAMEGMQTAYDGKFAPMLVPWTVTAPADETTDTIQNGDGTASYKGYAYRKYRNTFYSSRLRIEKLDSETGENLLHDGALFTLYAASREDGENTDGLVKFYETDTRIEGSKEFLEAMGARNITQEGTAWKGTIPAGTPICRESEQVILTDQEGRRTGQFEVFTTTRDGLQAQEENPASLSYQDQNVGYLTTPQPLGAGTYVLCEVKPPAGYVRTKPVAIEIYSDQTTYYLEGNRDNRVAAAIYEDQTGEGHQEITNTARIYIGNTPIRLEVFKIKDTENTVTYKTNTRLEGTELELKQKYGTENLEFAYKNGTYLGYAWYKGTLEYLESRKVAGEDAEPVYVDGVFAGYGLISRPLDTADDNNRYVAGAQMTLYDAIEVKENGDSGDYGYDGVEVVRDRNNNVQSIQVLEGHAGTTIEFIREEDEEGSLNGEPGEGTWTYRTIERGNTDILFYSLGELKVMETGTDGKLYGYDRNGNRVQIKNQESIYVLKAGQPVFELTGGDLTAVKYSAADKCFTLSPGTVLYHLDSNGNRDAYVNPTTGMAYTRNSGADPAKEGQKLLVWPVKVSKTKTGAVIAREKIKTWRIASINADTDQEYITGTYDGNSFNKSMNPVLNGHGLPEYYQRSAETYKKGNPIYDIDGDYVRYKYDDLLSAYNNAAYRINNRTDMEDIGNEEDTTDDKKLYHRQGEAWFMENTWITGEKYPNDPFKTDMTVGQADMLKRVIPGSYILEEVKAPSGYAKGFPEGITVTETREVQKTGMEDEKIKVEIVKTDAPDQYRINVISDYDPGSDTVTEPKGAYGYGQISGAHLVLFKANRIYTTDSVTYPKGYYLVKAESKPAEWTVENTANNAPVRIVADWITDGTPKYFEGIPAGDYILEEAEVGGGYVRSSIELTVKATGKVQTINLKNDHTKLEVYKYYVDSTGKKMQLPNSHAAGLALYEAKTDGNGTIVMDEGKPVFDKEKKITEWMTDDLTEYTEKFEKSTGFMDRIKDLLGLSENQSSFITDFEAAYKENGESLTSLTWYTKDGERTAELGESLQTGKGEGAVQIWITDAGKTIRITIYRNVKNGSLDSDGKLPLNFEYQFNYKEENGVKSYDTLEGMHRIDYLLFNAEKDGKKVGNYVLVEEKTPEGFETADPKAVVLEETGSVQRISLENKEKYINVLKVVTDGSNEYAVEGAELALYRADEAGDFVENESHLVETWLSGSDGRYTENDRFNGDVPEGLSVGDLKPHRIDKTPYGAYYIAELTPPAYMQKIDPVKILVGAEKIPVYRVVNIPTVGKLEIKKKASDTGQGLENARFKVTNKDNGDVWYMTTGTNGTAEITGLPVGLVQTDGTIRPYTYSMEEISPPDLYRITGGIKKFQFNGSESGKEVLYTYEVLNDPTEIHFKKTNFDNGMAVEGAEIAVYHAVAVNGEYQKDGEAIETLVSGADGFTLAKKLSANQVYIMEELKAPSGYTIAKPVIFTINKSGTGIRNVSNSFSVLKLASEDSYIEALTVTGRVPVKVYTVLKDLDTGIELPPLIGSGNIQAITTEDGVIDGHLYEITEYTKYSDGRLEKSFKETKRIYFDENESYILPSRTYLETRQELSDEEGNILASWTVNEANHDYTVNNPVTREVSIAQVTGSVGVDQSAVKTGNVIKYTVSYTNPYSHPADIRIKAVLTDGLEYLRSTDYGVEQNGIVTWNLTDIPAHESGTVDMVAVVNGEDGTQTKAYFETKVNAVIKRTTLINPIVPEGSITVINKLTGTGKDQADEFTFHVRLMDVAGKILTGYQAYSGSSEDRIKGEGNITITGDGFITFAGLPYGTRYEITQEKKDGYGNILSSNGQTEEGTITGEVSRAIQSAVFINNRNDETIREILTAGGNYQLTETTTYSDGSSLISGIYRFQLNADGMVDNVDMEDRPIHLYFSKVDVETGEELAGGKYVLTDEETGTVIYEFTKEKGEKIVVPAELITPGKKYSVKEDISPEGYSYENKICFTAEESGIPETIIMQDKKTEVEIKKVDEETGELLTRGRFSIREKETGTVIKTFVPEGKPYLLKGLLVAGAVYELVEEEPPAGYALSQSINFTVPEEPESITITMKDRKTEVLIKKLAGNIRKGTPSETEKQLEGSVLQILNEDKTPAKALQDGNGLKAGEDLIFITKSQFEHLKGQLEAGKSYWLHEVCPADGYAYAEDIPFAVSLNGDMDVIVMIDEPTHVILSKKAITGNEELQGNYMSIKDQEGNVVEEWISKEQPHELIAKLKAGERYWLHEIRPADGYAYAESVPFTVSKNGTVDIVEMKNKATMVRLKKVDTSGHLLQGAVLQVLDQQKNVVIPDFETTGEAIDITGRLTAGKIYYLHEVKAPSGYLLSSDVPFTVPKESKVLEVTMTDPKRQSPGSDKMHLYKADAATGKGLEGVEFSIYRSDGSLYLTVSTGTDGYAKFDVPANGTYTYKETKAVPGYLATDHIYSFTIQNGEVSDNSTMSVINYPSPEVLIQKADAGNSERLAGAELEIRNEAGIPVATGMTDENGEFLFRPLQTGKFTVHELKAPQGYIKTSTYLTIYVTDAGTVTGEFVIYNSPEHGKKRGFITATYQSNLSGLGIINHKGIGFWNWLSRIPRTGDIDLKGGLLVCIGLAGVVFGIAIIRRRKDKKDEE